MRKEEKGHTPQEGGGRRNCAQGITVLQIDLVMSSSLQNALGVSLSYSYFQDLGHQYSQDLQRKENSRKTTAYYGRVMSSTLISYNLQHSLEMFPY